VGNNAGDVIEPVVDGISAFRDELISPGELEPYRERQEGAFTESVQEFISSVCAEQFGATPSSRTCTFCDYVDLCERKEVGE